MARLEDLTRGATVRGVLPNAIVTVVDVKWFGSDVVELASGEGAQSFSESDFMPRQFMSRGSLAVAVLALLVAVGVTATERVTTRAPVVIAIPIDPVAFAGSDGRVHLAYELHVTNFDIDAGVLRLERVDAFGDLDKVPLAGYAGNDLEGRVMHPGAEAGRRYGRSVDGGRHAVIHVWITLERGRAIPASIRHRLLFQTEKGVEESVDAAQISIRIARPIPLGPPLKGGIWLVHNGPGNHRSPHWGSLLALNGRVTVPQRFAVDLIGLDENGYAVRKDFQTSANEDWIGFGAEVIAVADGVVRDMHDGTIDNRPLAPVPPPVSITATAVYGNYVVLEVDSHTFVHYVHLKPNSVSVKTGQHVRRGQLLGRVGNSGNTNGPHLHFHVSDAAAFENSEGLPFVIDSFEVLGETTAKRAIGAEPSSAPVILFPEPHHRELPLHGSVVRFR